MRTHSDVPVVPFNFNEAIDDVSSSIDPQHLVVSATPSPQPAVPIQASVPSPDPPFSLRLSLRRIHTGAPTAETVLERKRYRTPNFHDGTRVTISSLQVHDEVYVKEINAAQDYREYCGTVTSIDIKRNAVSVKLFGEAEIVVMVPTVGYRISKIIKAPAV